FTSNWVESWEASLVLDMHNHRRFVRGKTIKQLCGSTGPEHGRNITVKRWLLSGDYDAPWLLWTDSDMGWRFDAIERLMETADAEGRPIVGGLCFGMRPAGGQDDAHGYAFSQFPTVYDLGETEETIGVRSRYAYPVNRPQQVAATGSAFIVIHRSVFQ